MSLFCRGAGLALALVFAGSAAAAPPAARDFARAPAISDVSISPDGKHVVALTSPDGDRMDISVWRTDSLQTPPVVLGSARMRFLEVSFVKNDRLLVGAIQTLTIGEYKGHATKHYVTDLGGKVWSTLLPETRAEQSENEKLAGRLSDLKLISDLPRDPDDVLVEDQRQGDADSGDIYRVNVHTGAAQRVELASEKFGDYRADLKGDLRAKLELNYDGGKVYIAQWIRNPDTGVWQEHFRSFAKNREIQAVVGFSADPNIAYVAGTQGQDKRALYEYDIRQRKLLDPVFAHKLFDSLGEDQIEGCQGLRNEGLSCPVLQSRGKDDYGQVLGFTYFAERPRIYWVDDQFVAMAKGVNQALHIGDAAVDWVDPGTGTTARIDTVAGAAADIISWSDDRGSVIVKKSGPRQPAEYYLLTGGAKLSLLGRSRPWIDASTLGDERLVEYPARDGLMIPAFLITPPKAIYGPGPYPTLIEPHGGPWARDEMDWDVTGWTQYFAARGYAVLQPQFRGSEGWGQKMQDDKDDGVKWLAAQGIADPRRVAMFGYSYGGYAALAAAVRPHGLYQCAISGAGAGDLAAIQRATFDNRFEREFQRATIAGLDPLEHAKDAQIPVFLYHGDRDRTVRIEQSHKFVAALKAGGKPYRYLEIPDMGHQFVTWTPAMGETQLVQVEDFLKTGCKPGGL